MAGAPREVWGDLAATAFVESSLVFRSLDDEARGDLVRLARVVDVAAGEVVSAAGDDGFVLVREGVASVQVVGPDGAAVELGDVERGGLFGVSRVFGAARAGALVARTAVSAVVLPAPVVAALAERFPKMKRLLEAVLAAREKEADQRLGPARGAAS